MFACGTVTTRYVPVADDTLLVAADRVSSAILSRWLESPGVQRAELILVG